MATLPTRHFDLPNGRFQTGTQLNATKNAGSVQTVSLGFSLIAGQESSRGNP